MRIEHPLGRRDRSGQLDDRLGGNARDVLHVLRRERLDVRLELVEAVRPALDELAVVEALRDQDAEHAEGERPVGSRTDADPLAAQRPRRVGAPVVDDDDPRTTRPCLLQRDGKRTEPNP